MDSESEPFPLKVSCKFHWSNVTMTRMLTWNDSPRQHSISSASEHQAYPSPKGFSSSTETESTESIRVVQNRPKPQCWDHGCNGRKFSTFSNLLRHQREKSGVATKSSCPNCGAEFTRTTARNGHMAHDKCKQRKSSQ
jgi:hypothetical protein